MKNNGKIVVYIAVSPDKYELPIAVADSEKELCQILGVRRNAVSEHICRAEKGKLKKQKYFAVELENGE